MKKLSLIGAHVSIAGGFKKSLQRGASIPCNAIQIFTKSNKQWHAKPINREEAEVFREEQKHSFVKSVIAHASYLINLGSPQPDIEQRSRNALLIELQRCDQLAIPDLVLHPGAFIDSSPQECVQRIARNIDFVLQKYQGNAKILLENTAGQGTNVGYTFEQLAQISKNITEKKRVGFCFDTCHAFAAGYQFDNQALYEKMWHDFDNILGLDNLYAIHLNDSKKKCGSHVDRHEHIGHGKIGLEAFQLILNDERFFALPKILETPKNDDDLKADKMNMQTIYSLVNNQKNKCVAHVS